MKKLILLSLGSITSVFNFALGDPNAALIEAARVGDLEEVRKLLLSNGKEDMGDIDVDARGEEERTPLIFAAYNNHPEIVALLLQYGADVNAQEKKGYTALIGSMYCGCTEVVKVLLNHESIDVNKCLPDHSTALMYAAQVGNTEIVNLLLGKGADVNAQNDDGYTALILAAKNGHLEVVKTLLNREGIEIDACTKFDDPSKSGITALIFASNMGYKEVVSSLVEHGANVNARSNNGLTAIMAAAYRGAMETVQVLLDRGAKVDETLPRELIDYCERENIIETLLQEKLKEIKKLQEDLLQQNVQEVSTRFQQDCQINE